MQNAGIIDQNVQAAPGSLQFLNDIRNLFAAGNIAADGKHSPTKILNLLGHFGETDFVDIHQANVGPFLSEGQRDRTPNSRCRTGDESALGTKCSHMMGNAASWKVLVVDEQVF